jgi:hypothetical protein
LVVISSNSYYYVLDFLSIIRSHEIEVHIILTLLGGTELKGGLILDTNLALDISIFLHIDQSRQGR